MRRQAGISAPRDIVEASGTELRTGSQMGGEAAVRGGRGRGRGGTRRVTRRATGRSARPPAAVENEAVQGARKRRAEAMSASLDELAAAAGSRGRLPTDMVRCGDRVESMAADVGRVTAEADAVKERIVRSLAPVLREMEVLAVRAREIDTELEKLRRLAVELREEAARMRETVRAKMD